MQTWNDSKNREWQLALDFGNIRKVHRLTGVDMFDPAESTGVVGLSARRRELGETLWLLSAAQAEHRGVTQDEFFSALDSDALAEGFEALCNEFIDFCQPAMRAAVRAALETQLEALATTAIKIAETITSAASQAAIATAIDQTVTTAQEMMTTLGRQPSESAQSAA